MLRLWLKHFKPFGTLVLYCFITYLLISYFYMQPTLQVVIIFFAL